ncbi:sarcosine oxidase subunit delta [Aquicoccus porphyridii]|uniref:sarcosine oxidase subunit delta n=1 Tax=Aquicoccus porphyridii TaxID=1852029 RepID=UPI00273DD701|nr:sarcosine oxidase subunit delta [Aquicoccus porphyridii]
MRIDCPCCGSRDIREFTYKGDALALDRPDPDAGDAVWNDYVHNRDNPAGPTRELWYHEMGCAAWLVVTRDTVSHEIEAVELASAAKGDVA